MQLIGADFGVAPLLTGLAVATIASIGFLGIHTGVPLGYLLIAVAAWAAANHAFEIVEHAALGRPGWPVLSLETFVTARRQIGALFALAVALLAIAWQASPSPALRLGLAVLAAGAPAAAALLAVMAGELRALRPDKVLGTIAGLGLWYLALLLGAVVAARLVLAAATGHWLWLAAAALGLFGLAYGLGAAVYARRLALGVHAPRAPEVLAAAEEARRAAIRAHALDHAYGIGARVRPEGAVRYIEEHVRSAADPLREAIACYFAMARWEGSAAARLFGRDLVERLETDGRAAEAAKIRASCELLDKRAAGAPARAER